MKTLATLAVLVVLGAAPAYAEFDPAAPTCDTAEDPAQGAPICRHSNNPQQDLLNILRPLWNASGYGKNVKVYFLDSVHEPNAVAMAPNVKPNTEDVAKIGVTVGIWDIVQSDSEMAFVLAHELSHIVGKDIEYLQGIVPDLFNPWYEKLSPQEQAAGSEALAARFGQIIMNPRKQKVEQEADINALNLIRLVNASGEAEFDINGAITFLQRMGHEFPEHNVLTINSDHPTADQRIHAAEGVQLHFYTLDADYLASHPGTYSSLASRADPSGVSHRTEDGSAPGLDRSFKVKAIRP
jgi:Zn-dependent protease with chaperone function